MPIKFEEEYVPYHSYKEVQKALSERKKAFEERRKRGVNCLALKRLMNFDFESKGCSKVVKHLHPLLQGIFLLAFTCAIFYSLFPKK